MKSFTRLSLIFMLCGFATTIYLQNLAPTTWQSIKETVLSVAPLPKAKPTEPMLKKSISATPSHAATAQSTPSVLKPFLNSFMPPTMTATLSAAVVTDNAPMGASATDVLEYTAVINNAGTDATNVVFTDVLDNNTTLVAGSVTATPIAVNDAYTCIGNVGITVPASAGLLANDVSPMNLTRTVTAESGSTANGFYTIAADGSFTYTPNPGFTGSDNFTYTLNAGTVSATAMVILTVPNVIWFVNPSVSVPGTGTLASPFKALSNVTGTATGNIIFLYTGTYTGNLTLLASQKLIGQGATASLASITGLSFANAPASLPATGGTNPTWNSAALTLNSGNDVQGINLNSTSGTTMTGGSTNVGALKVRDVSLSNTNGQALSIGSGGALDIIFKSISASNAGTGLSVSNSTGSFQVLGTGTTDGSGGTINNITNRGVEFISCTNITLKNMNFTSANTANGGTCDGSSGNSGCNGVVYLRSANTVTLDNINISGTTAQMGINANDVTSLAVKNSNIANCGNEVYEGCMVANSLKGTCEITNSILSVSAQRVVNVVNVGSEVLTMNVTNSTLSDAPEVGLLFEITGSNATGNATLNVKNSNFLGNQSSGVLAQNSGNSTMTFNMDGSTVDPGTGVGLGIGAVSFGNGTGRSTYNFNIGTIAANTIRGRAGTVANVLMQGKSDGQGRIQNNLIQKVFTMTGGNAGAYLSAKSQEYSTLKIDITGNQCRPVQAGGAIITDLTTFMGGATTQFGIDVWCITRSRK
jgi:trimeric autotransporter adhesin